MALARFVLSLAAAGAVVMAAAPARAQPLYHLVQSIPLGGGLKWDYLHFDALSHRLYVSHGTQVDVIDTRTETVIGTLKNLPGSHGIAIDPASGEVFADSATRRAVIAFDAESFAPHAAMPVGFDADGMVYDRASRQIFVAGGDGDVVTPIDPATHTSAADIPLGGAPEFLAADGAGALYINIEDKNEILRIDTAKNTIVAHWPLGACRRPKGLALDAAARLLFASCANGVMAVVNADTGAILATPRIGMGTDFAAFDPRRHRAFSANGAGSVTIVSDAGGKIAVLAQLKTAPGARTMAVDPASGDIYLAVAQVAGAPPPVPGKKPHFTFVPGSFKILVYAPAA